jgi:NADPH2:quinone reductase
MNPGGRWILVATLGGETTEIPLRTVLKKHLRIMGSTLRSRSDDEKSRILSKLESMLWQDIAAGKIKPVIEQTFALADAAEAHKVLAAQKNIGKVIPFIEKYADKSTANHIISIIGNIPL